QQQQQQQQQHVVPQVLAQQQQLVPQLAQHVQHPQTVQSGAAVAISKPGGVTPESMSKEELIQCYQRLQQALAGNTLPPKQVTVVKMQMHKLQAELAKPYRQEQMPQAISANNVQSLSPGAVASQAAVASTPLSASSTALVQPSQPMPQPAIIAELAPQIKELQQVETKMAPPQPVEPLEFLALTYKTLVGADDAGSFNDEVVARESLFMLHNAFEGFVGKRVGNGPGQDVYDEGPRKRPRPPLKDETLADLLLCNEDGHPDAFMASYIDWAQEIRTA
ncbi:hypothetical protein BGZ80_007661, partial [Entomortierella chlamydospora]